MSSAGRIVPRTPRPPNLTRDYGSTLADLAGEHAPCSPVELTFEPVLSCMSTAYVVIGIAYALFGYRCFKSSMFLTGFTFGSSIVYLICLQEYLLPPYGNVCVAVCAGVLFGLITMLIQYVGLFITGFHSGVLVAIGGLSVYDQFVDRRPQTMSPSSPSDVALVALFTQSSRLIYRSLLYSLRRYETCIIYCIYNTTCVHIRQAFILVTFSLFRIQNIFFATCEIS